MNQIGFRLSCSHTTRLVDNESGHQGSELWDELSVRAHAPDLKKCQHISAKNEPTMPSPAAGSAKQSRRGPAKRVAGDLTETAKKEPTSPRGWPARLSASRPRQTFDWRSRLCSAEPAGSAFHQAAAFTGQPLIVSSPSRTETCTVSPSLTPPARICSASGSCTCLWMTRFNGRAPYAGS